MAAAAGRGHGQDPEPGEILLRPERRCPLPAVQGSGGEERPPGNDGQHGKGCRPHRGLRQLLCPERRTAGLSEADGQPVFSVPKLSSQDKLFAEAVKKAYQERMAKKM